MNYQHKNLAQGRWQQIPFLEQMANIGSEVSRALRWQSKENHAYCRQAAERALELIDLTLVDVQTFPRLKEITRMREALVDYFFGTNQYSSTPKSWENYFLPFAYSARKGR
ncbi:MAG: hypothetical protein JXD21_07360 [Candidatus Omnitrophica bacterium]|nr:hypothetical protein [Candidatus Omnitrophota bacterium]